MKKNLKSAEVWFKIVLLFVFSAFFILAIPYPQESRQFPQLLAAISLAFTVIALGMDFLRAAHDAVTHRSGTINQDPSCRNAHALGDFC